jgi:hypothetical protein
MNESLRRPWTKHIRGYSLIGISLLIAAVCVFGYGIVQNGLVASHHSEMSAIIMEQADELQARADLSTDPYEREQLLDMSIKSQVEAIMELNKHWEQVRNHKRLIIIGIVLSLAGIIILIVHRRRTRNLI